MIRSFILFLLLVFSTRLFAQLNTAGNIKLSAADAKAIEGFQAQLEQDIRQYMHNSHTYNALAKTTGDDTTGYDLPIVFHVIHDYGTTDYMADSLIYNAVSRMNTYFLKQNPDTANVIAPYVGFIRGTNKRYIGNARIHFRLATKDPQGNPTHGITRRRSYLTHNGNDQAKLDMWPPEKYYNVWLIEKFDAANTGATGYSFMPATAATFPYNYIDGTILLVTALYPTVNYVSDFLIRESARYLGLFTFFTGYPCYDGDFIDDTPPGPDNNSSPCTGPPSYPSTCASPYFKSYTAQQAYDLYGIPNPITIDYPDTVNVQNIMGWGGCQIMFTYGQTQRMRGTLHSSVANRDNLIKPQNVAFTGSAAPFPDLPPIPDFSLSKTYQIIGAGQISDRVYGCADGSFKVQFTDRSWNDTITGVEWNFSNGASTPTSTASVVSTSFSQPGWVTITQKATGNNTGTTTKVSSKSIYIAAYTGMDPHEYFEEFSPVNGTSDKWPMFNYYNNNWKWEMTNDAGYYDHSSVRYKNFDRRLIDTPFYPASLTGTPKGDYDDLFSPPFDLSGTDYTTNCNLNFMSAYASAADLAADKNDTLEVLYSTNCGNSWTLLSTIAKNKLENNPSTVQDFVPTYMNQWILQSIPVPTAAKTSKTMFRFRYRPGTFLATPQSPFYLMGSGNNFYMDDFHISSFPTGVDETMLHENGMALTPNPTTGKTLVLITGGSGIAQLRVTNITGKLVYTTQQTLTDNVTTIEIPAETIPVKGIYLVQMRNNDKIHTEKLVVY